MAAERSFEPFLPRQEIIRPVTLPEVARVNGFRESQDMRTLHSEMSDGIVHLGKRRDGPASASNSIILPIKAHMFVALNASQRRAPWGHVCGRVVSISRNTPEENAVGSLDHIADIFGIRRECLFVSNKQFLERTRRNLLSLLKSDQQLI